MDKFFNVKGAHVYFACHWYHVMVPVLSSTSVVWVLQK